MRLEWKPKALLGSMLCMVWASIAFASAPSVEDWQNPGGMWTPPQILLQGELLKGLGLEIDPAQLSRADSDLLQAVVHLGFCSGSFVSPDGLVVTNHHCVAGMLSTLSKMDENPSADYVKTGFKAKSRDEERNVGPTQRLFVTQSIEDVTVEVVEGLDAIVCPTARGEMIESRIKEIVARAEAQGDSLRANVKGFFRGEQYLLTTQFEIKDVRMVMAPEVRVGKFGGDTDNWRWPRQTGDFGFIRAYVAPDGSSREYHPDNVPYQAENFLKVSQTALNPQDLVLVMGYPGSTNRLDTADEVREEIGETIPRLSEKYGSLNDLLIHLSTLSEDKRKKLESSVSSLNNFLKNRKSALGALNKIAYQQQRGDFETELMAWVNACPMRQSEYGSVFAEMEEIRTQLHEGHLRRALEGDLASTYPSKFIHLIRSAVDIVRMAEERPKSDDQRNPKYQKRQWQNLAQAEEAAQLGYDRQVSIAVFQWVITRALNLSDDQIPEVIKELVGDLEIARSDSSVVSAQLGLFYQQTELESLERRLELLTTATTEELVASEDPFIKLAVVLGEVTKQNESLGKKASGLYHKVAPRYIRALRSYAHSKRQWLAPDANSTLRITYGHVDGYVKPSNSQWQFPFTTVDSLVAKHVLGDDEFEVPQDVQRAVKGRDFGSWGNALDGGVPVNFLAAVDTTGGNSGSAAINVRGELVGLLFDGNEDALYSDWKFDHEQVRSILVDIRFVLWYLDKVSAAQWLLDELLP